MKRKAIATFLIVWMFMAGLEMSAYAEEGFKCFFHMYKQVSSRGEEYGTRIYLHGKILEKVNSVSIKVPYHKKFIVENWLGFDGALFSTGNMTYEQFNRRFPEGKYIVTLFPSRYGKYSVDRYHDFPDLTVTYPVEDAVDVPRKPKIQWNPLTNVKMLTLRVETQWGSYGASLDPETTSYTPYWTLDPNSEYTLYLEASSLDSRGNKTVTTQKVSFTTGK